MAEKKSRLPPNGIPVLIKKAVDKKPAKRKKKIAACVDRTHDLQMFGLQSLKLEAISTKYRLGR
jgi:hypothetical protein